MAIYESGPLERVCPVCKSVFMARSIWVYKTGYNERLKFYCSWKCYRAAQRKQARQKSTNPPVKRPHIPVTDQEKNTIVEMLMNGYSVKDIAAKTGRSAQTVFYYKTKVMKA